MAVSLVEASALRWRCDAATLGFESTDEVAPIPGIAGQDAAVDALRFGLALDAPSSHVFVRGLAGTGRIALVRELLEQQRSQRVGGRDLLVVRNFAEHDAPRIVQLPAGTAPAARTAVEALVRFIRDELADRLGETDLLARQAELEQATEGEIRAITEPFEAGLAVKGLRLVQAEDDDGDVSTVIVAVVDGEPITLDDLAEKGADEAELQRLQDGAREGMTRFQEIAIKVSKLRRRLAKAAEAALQQEAHALLVVRAAEVAQDFPALVDYLDELTTDVTEHRLARLTDDDMDWLGAYGVHVLLARDPKAPRPVVVDSAPTVQSLLGSVVAPMDPTDLLERAHMAVHAGSLLRADGGTLILDAADLLSEPGAYKALTRTLKAGEVVLAAGDASTTLRTPGIRPDPVPLRVKVVLIGDVSIYHALDEIDEDFAHLFKILADFDDELPRVAHSAKLYAGVLARITRNEQLPAFEAGAVAALMEHGARVVSSPGAVTAQIGRVLDVAREAAWVCRARKADRVARVDVQDAVSRIKTRADAPGRRFRLEIQRGRVRVAVTGRATGQINGLATTSAGPLNYGIPLRLTATAGPGTGGAINVEREAELSGSIHTKSHYLLTGLLRRLLQAPHPLAFDATLAFEQSYGGVDGDSASVAAFICLLSAITGVTVRQDLAVTGALDQVGNVLPIGAVNEKIEGFYDVCNAIGLTGQQGVVIPAANVGELMLREDVITACAAGRFSVIAVDSIADAAEVFLGLPFGLSAPWEDTGEATVIGTAREVMAGFWEAVRPR